MRKGWIAFSVCTALIGAVTLTTTGTQAAMVIGDGKANISLIEQIAKKRKKSKAVCTQKLIFTCCTEPGKQEVCDIK